MTLWATTSETYLCTCAPSEYLDQPVRSRSLIRIFTGRILDSQGWKVSSCGQPLRKRAYSNIMKISSSKNENFQIKNSDIFHAEIRKIMYTPVNPSFTKLKWGLRGSKLYRHVFVIFIGRTCQKVLFLTLWLLCFRRGMRNNIWKAIHLFWCHGKRVPNLHSA